MWAEVIKAPWMEEMHPKKASYESRGFQSRLARNLFNIDVWQVGISSLSCTQVTISLVTFVASCHPLLPSLAPEKPTESPSANAEPSAPPLSECTDLAAPAGTVSTWHKLIAICVCHMSHAFDFFLVLKFPHVQGKTAEDIFMVSTLNSDEALETQEMKKQTKRPGRKSSKQRQRTNKCQNTFS